MKSIAALCALSLFGCSSVPRLSLADRETFTSALSVCAVIADAARYDGQDLLIRGLYRLQPHGPIFIGRTCSKEEVELHKSKDYKENEDAKHIRDSLIDTDDTKPVDVVYRGKFKVVHGFSCSLVACFNYKLDVSELVAAQAE